MASQQIEKLYLELIQEEADGIILWIVCIFLYCADAIKELFFFMADARSDHFCQAEA